MKRLIPLLLLLLSLQLSAQNAQNMRVLSKWNDTSIPKVDGDQIWNDCMGWKDSLNDREYFIAGSPDSIYVFNITDPDTMILCDVVAGRARSAINRDYEVYQHYLYTVSDRTVGTGALQIFDLQYLPDSLHEVFNNDTFGSSTHTIYIEAASKRLYMCMNTLKPAGISPMDVLSIADPENPTFLGRLVPPGSKFARVHEMYARHDTVYLSCETSGLFIMDMRDPANAVFISSIEPPYPQNGYNHSSWLDSTGKYLMFTDENQGLGIKLYDLTDIHNPSFLTVWNSHSGALPHNAFWKGGYAYVSSYEDGVYVYDLRNPASLVYPATPKVIAYYDTYPLNPAGGYTGFHGCWGVWPYLPSGNILASDISQGLFVLNTLYPLAVEETTPALTVKKIYPNPFGQILNAGIRTTQSGRVMLKLYTLQGMTVAEKNLYLQAGNNTITLEVPPGLSQGFYLLNVQSGNGSSTFKVMKD